MTMRTAAAAVIILATAGAVLLYASPGKAQEVTADMYGRAKGDMYGYQAARHLVFNSCFTSEVFADGLIPADSPPVSRTEINAVVAHCLRAAEKAVPWGTPKAFPWPPKAPSK